MSERGIRRRLDDLDGQPVTDHLNERIEFSFRGMDYVIDLRPTNAEKLKSVLRQYINHAQLVEPATNGKELIDPDEVFDSGHCEDTLPDILRWGTVKLLKSTDLR